MKHHFFLSSAASWRTGCDLLALIAEMKRDGYPFSIWYVPVQENSPYKIEMYAPQVPGAIELAVYLKAGKKWILIGDSE